MAHCGHTTRTYHQKIDALRLTDIHVSLLSWKNTGAQARSGERALVGCRTAQLAFCLSAVVPAFAEPDIHSVSRARRPSQKIECVFSASPETVRREPREFHLRRSVGQWRDLAVRAVCVVLFYSLAWFSGRVASAIFCRYEISLSSIHGEKICDHLARYASLDWRSLSVFFLAAANRAQHQWICHLNLCRMWMEMIVDPTGKNRRFHRNVQGCGRVLIQMSSSQRVAPSLPSW